MFGLILHWRKQSLGLVALASMYGPDPPTETYIYQDNFVLFSLPHLRRPQLRSQSNLSSTVVERAITEIILLQIVAQRAIRNGYGMF